MLVRDWVVSVAGDLMQCSEAWFGEDVCSLFSGLGNLKLVH